ncbi:ThuA domain-containing protein [Pseudonocardia sp. GCM10023141]|uniref:ThuA domain-containing protein n=1 Tax=Pseudonocardia sp. GCM10023141 TaxID=3252653 RepID=UPI003611CE86
MPANKTALVVRGGWEGHRPVEATELYIPYLKANGFDVRTEESTAVYADEAYLAEVDLILQCVTMSTIERAEFRGLRLAIEAGTGFAGWHGGIADSFRNTSDYLHLVGGQFGCHPGIHPFEDGNSETDNFVPYTVEISDAGRAHPITAGIEDFDLVTEQYWVLADSYVNVLATTTQRRREFDPWHREVVHPAIWTRDWGRGRIFVCTPGHSLDVLQDGNVRTIIERGLLWASR